MEDLKITPTDEGIEVVETKQYTMTANDIKNELNNISWRKDDLIRQSQRLKSDFDKLTARETELKKALENLEAQDSFESLGEI